MYISKLGKFFINNAKFLRHINKIYVLHTYKIHVWCVIKIFFFSLKLYEYTDDYKYYDNHIISYLFHDLHFCNILCSTPKLRFSERGRQTTFVH